MATLISPIPNQPIAESHEWRDWFFRLGQNINTGGIVTWGNIVFDGSNITSIVNRRHNDLQGLQGGATSGLEYYHLDSTQYALINTLPTGLTVTITTAKLTPTTGANGSMTFVNGILTAQTQAT
jgi:hypothetical protein